MKDGEKTYSTSQIAGIVGLHPNTVRKYEEWGLLQTPERKPNGYRVYTDVHIKQFELAKKALQSVIVQAGRCTTSLGYNQQRCKRKSSLKLQKNCPFVCTAFDFAKVNKVASVQPICMDFQFLLFYEYTGRIPRQSQHWSMKGGFPTLTYRPVFTQRSGVCPTCVFKRRKNLQESRTGSPDGSPSTSLNIKTFMGI